LVLHATFVIAAFGLLFAYVGCLTLLWWRNGGGRLPLGANLVYLAVLAAYFVVAIAGPSLATESGHTVQVTAQKIVAYTSMVHLAVIAFALLVSERPVDPRRPR